MIGYRSPAKSQTTNISNNAEIKTLLQSGAAVDILALPDNGLLYYGQFHINLAAGLEDNIISLLKPDWNRNKTSPSDIAPRLHTSQQLPRPTGSFRLTLQKTYFNRGFFNVGVANSNLFGSDGQEIEIFCGSSEQPIIGTINRTANINKTPRIMGRRGLRDWMHQEMHEMQESVITVLSQIALRIEPYKG